MFKEVAEIEIMKLDGIVKLILQLGETGHAASLTVTGNSMYPFLRDCRDSVTLEMVTYYSPRIGDIVLFSRESGQYILHRIVKIRKQMFYALGDAQTMIEGPLSIESIVAVAVSVSRDEKNISTDGFMWRTLSFTWMFLRPVRRILLRMIPKFSRLLHSLK